jgi:hypothetical protein
MDAVGLVDLQPQLRLIVLPWNKLVHTGRAESSLGAIELGNVDLHRNRLVLDLQVAWLVFIVVGVATTDVGQQVEADFTILNTQSGTLHINNTHSTPINGRNKFQCTYGVGICDWRGIFLVQQRLIIRVSML